MNQYDWEFVTSIIGLASACLGYTLGVARERRRNQIRNWESIEVHIDSHLTPDKIAKLTAATLNRTIGFKR